VIDLQALHALGGARKGEGCARRHPSKLRAFFDIILAHAPRSLRSQHVFFTTLGKSYRSHRRSARRQLVLSCAALAWYALCDGQNLHAWRATMLDHDDDTPSHVTRRAFLQSAGALAGMSCVHYAEAQTPGKADERSPPPSGAATMRIALNINNARHEL